jgi:arylsulfatase A-like enzyme
MSEFDIDPLRGDIPTLGTILSDHGYATAWISSNPLLAPRFGLSRGFGYYANLLNLGQPYTTLRMALDKPSAKPFDAAAIVDRVIDILATPHTRPLALVAHFMDPHRPYAPPQRWRRAPGPESEDMTDYDGEVSYVDEQFGRLWTHLKRTGIASRTVVVFTADHGEAFTVRPNAAVGLLPPPTTDEDVYRKTEHGHTMYQELLHVPLLLYGPHITPRTESHVTRSVDVLPTLLEALGLPVSSSVEGRSVLRSMTDDVPALSEAVLFGLEKKSWREGRFKLIYRTGYPADERFELYDLQADPGETVNLASVQPDRAMDMFLRLTAYRTRVASLSWPRAKVRASDQLRSLGYVSGR